MIDIKQFKSLSFGHCYYRRLFGRSYSYSSSIIHISPSYASGQHSLKDLAKPLLDSGGGGGPMQQQIQMETFAIVDTSSTGIGASEVPSGAGNWTSPTAATAAAGGGGGGGWSELSNQISEGCVQCKTPLSADEMFCPSCGTKRPTR